MIITISIINLVIDLAEGKSIDNSCRDDLAAAYAILQKEPDLKEHLYIKKNSKSNCFRQLEYELISHRNKEKPFKTEATSAVLRMLIEKEKEDFSCSFEISKKDLNSIINTLIELREKLDMVSKEGKNDRTN